MKKSVILTLAWILTAKLESTTCNVHPPGDDQTGTTCTLLDEDGTQYCKTHIPPKNEPWKQPKCGLYMAPSKIPNAGLGMFLGYRNVTRGQRLEQGEVVIQMVDPPQDISLRLLAMDYLWDGSDIGGQYEGKRVFSVVPGLGMAANGHWRDYNAILYRADVDEADCDRVSSPGAGAITHYHNLSFYSSKNIHEGGEILVNYDEDDNFPGLSHIRQQWVQERSEKNIYSQKLTPKTLHYDINDLRQHGICMDNLTPSRSKIHHAGRGAFVTRFIPQNHIITATPLIPISRHALQMTRNNTAKYQLLLNYCYGHANSTLLLFPYAPNINLLNHASDAPPNAKLIWSSHPNNHSTDWTRSLTISQLYNRTHSGLMLDLVSLRDIYPGEEILIDYGPAWQKAWNHHVQSWSSPPDAQEYTPAYIMDDVASILRTREEQKQHPYPKNLITACFYIYKDNEEEDTKQTSKTTMTFRWKPTRGIYEYVNLRPCTLLSRDIDPDRKQVYTVLMRNKPNMRTNEIIKGRHIVTHVPREAIQFRDRFYSTDQHLENAFRHEIHLGDDVWPVEWMDLL